MIENKQNNLVVGILGTKGSGKTLLLTILLYLDFLSGKKIYTNYEVNFPHEIIDINKLINLDKELTNSTIGITEIHTICDSRRSGNKQNVQFSYFVLQSRHRSVNLYYDSQFNRQFDIRIRENTDITIVTENLFIDSDNDGINDIFRAVIQDKRIMPVTYKELMVYGRPFFDKYNTDYIVNPFTMKEIKGIKTKVKE
ncbi:MAG: hypothetical protein MUO82_10850 [Candidatus Thermoplasmatota archaeon]|nr:hypothetical protein [Candidatus Thermoplasmatota archaeon]